MSSSYCKLLKSLFISCILIILRVYNVFADRKQLLHDAESGNQDLSSLPEDSEVPSLFQDEEMMSESSEILPAEAEDTADFLLFFDQLFDSLNGSTKRAQNGKAFRCAVSAKSPHEEFWEDAIKMVDSMEFIPEKKG